MKDLLIYGAMVDPHLIRVSERLIAKGVKVFFIDPKSVPNVSYSFLGSTSKEHRYDIAAIEFGNGKPAKINLENILFWRRNKRRVPVIYNEELQHEHYTIAETDNFIDGLVSLKRIPEVSSTIERFRHEHKLYQLSLANSAGLNIPPSLISNNLDHARDFTTSRNCIVKTLKHPTWMPPLSDPSKGVTILVNSLTHKELLDADPSSFSAFPLIIQEEIKKEHELRVVAFDGSLVAYKIYSQNVEEARLDWRRGTGRLHFERTNLADKLCQNIYKYLTLAGIGYGVFDFAVSQFGDEYFLECNSDGQWAFLEKNAQQCVISDMFCEEIYKMIQNAR